MQEAVVKVQVEERQQTADGDGQLETMDSVQPEVFRLQNHGVRLWHPF